VSATCAQGGSFNKVQLHDHARSRKRFQLKDNDKGMVLGDAMEMQGHLRGRDRSPRLTELLQSATAGCSTCGILALATGLRLIMKRPEYACILWPTTSVSLEIWRVLLKEWSEWTFSLTPCKQDSSNSMFLQVSVLCRFALSSLFSNILIWVKSLWPGLGPGVDLGEILSLDRSVEKIRDWTDFCDEQHKECSERSSSALPTRLIEVGLVGADK
jgi:hypothetical protein